MEVVEIRPVPRFKEIKRERTLQGTIWVVKTKLHGTYVSHSAKAIVRALEEKGVKMWVTAIYHRHQNVRIFRCKDANDVNAALQGERGATFVVLEPLNWIIDSGETEETDAAIISRDGD